MIRVRTHCDCGDISSTGRDSRCARVSSPRLVSRAIVLDYTLYYTIISYTSIGAAGYSPCTYTYAWFISTYDLFRGAAGYSPYICELHHFLLRGIDYVYFEVQHVYHLLRMPLNIFLDINSTYQY